MIPHEKGHFFKQLHETSFLSLAPKTENTPS